MGTIQHTAVAAQHALFDVAPRAQPAGVLQRATAPAEQLPLWFEPHDVHLTQFASPRVPDAVARGPRNGNCGPTSAVMAARLAGHDMPGFTGERVQAVISSARMLATGADDASDWTNLDELTRVFDAAGVAVRRLHDADEVVQEVRAGGVAIVRGNSGAAEWWNEPWRSPIAPPGGTFSGHLAVFSRYYPESGRFAVNDPGNQSALYVTERQARGFIDEGMSASPGYNTALAVDGPSIDIRPATVRRG